MKRILGKILRFFYLELNFLYDYMRFKKYYSKDSDASKNKKNLEAWILQDKHRIEKALSLPKPKYFFGELVLNRLFGNLIEYRNHHGKDRVYYFGIGAFQAYEDFHLNSNKELPMFFKCIKDKLDTNDFKKSICKLVGVNDVVIADGKFAHFFSEFVLSRHSCRNFDMERVVGSEIIKTVMELRCNVSFLTGPVSDPGLYS